MMDDPASALDPAARDALRQMAHAAYARGDLEEAAHLQRKIIAAGPPDADDALLLALTLYAARDVDGGIASLRDAVAHFPDHPGLRENLGVFLLTSGDAEGAVLACRSAQTLGSASPNVLDCLSEALLSLDRHDEAVEAGRAALEEDSTPEWIAAMIGAPALAGTDRRGSRSAWWTDGSPRVHSVRLDYDRLPRPSDYAAMLGIAPDSAPSS